MYDTLYSIMGEDYSPQVDPDLIPDVANVGVVVANHQNLFFDQSQVVDAAFVPRPPDPATGGKSGTGKPLGWTTGLRRSRAFRQPFGGATLVVPSMGVHPVQGPVGFSTRPDRLAYGVAALNAADIPTDDSVGDQYATLSASSVAAATAGNPNYG